MSQLRSEIVTPIHSYTFRAVALAVSFGVIGVAVGLSAQPEIDVPPPPLPVIQDMPVAMPIMIVAVDPPAADVTDVRSSEAMLVFRAADTTYMKLASLADPAIEALPEHGALTVYDRGEVDRWQTLTIGDVADRDVPLAHRRWSGKTVVVDGTCTAKVTGFAIVARLTGKTDYADVEGSAWTAASVLEYGALVLAAKLEGCQDGTLARDAGLSPIVGLAELHDAALAKRARTKLLASIPAQKAQAAWDTDERDGEWQTSKSAATRTIIARHPTTNVTWVSVHMRVEEGCGGPDINIWGLYRVEGDELVTAQHRDLGELHSIDKLIDIDGDGELELLGKSWLDNNTIVTRASGDELVQLALPFYGCPC